MMGGETIEALKGQHDLRDLASAYTALKRESSTEMSGPCPKCGGHDRFHVLAGWWFCRQCYLPDNGQAHDVIAFVMWVEGLDFQAAVEHLGGEMQKGAKRRKKAQPKRLTRPDNGPPPEKWQERARRFAAHCQEQLWSEAGQAALDYLHGRGLADETLKTWGVGYNPGDPKHGFKPWPFRAKEWGVESRAKEIANGITFPWEAGGALWYVKIRFLTDPDDSEKPRYISLPGSGGGGIYARLTGKPDLFVVEGEIDTLSLWQAIFDLADVLTVGSKTGQLSDRWLPALLAVKRFWIATDLDDDFTDEPAVKFWCTLAGDNAERLIPPGGQKDVNASLMAGEDLRAWAIGEMRRLKGREGCPVT